MGTFRVSLLNSYFCHWASTPNALAGFWGRIHGIHTPVPAGGADLTRWEIPVGLTQDFWGRIHDSYALVPAFGMPVYYESRISSTILASLITGVCACMCEVLQPSRWQQDAHADVWAGRQAGCI